MEPCPTCRDNKSSQFSKVINLTLTETPQQTPSPVVESLELKYSHLCYTMLG